MEVKASRLPRRSWSQQVFFPAGILSIRHPALFHSTAFAEFPKKTLCRLQRRLRMRWRRWTCLSQPRRWRWPMDNIGVAWCWLYDQPGFLSGCRQPWRDQYWRRGCGKPTAGQSCRWFLFFSCCCWFFIQVTSYVNEIYSYLRIMEKEQDVKADYLAGQTVMSRLDNIHNFPNLDCSH